jgi:hypothetical protein
MRIIGIRPPQRIGRQTGPSDPVAFNVDYQQFNGHGRQRLDMHPLGETRDLERDRLLSMKFTRELAQRPQMRTPAVAGSGARVEFAGGGPQLERHAHCNKTPHGAAADRKAGDDRR